jgi:hypothetical protein
MAMYILYDAEGIGTDDLNPLQAFVDLVIIANEVSVGVEDIGGGLQLVSYARTLTGSVQERLDELVNTTFTPDYGAGAQEVDIVIIAALSNFVLGDGASVANNGTALPPQGTGLPGAVLNPTDNCLVIYDTQQNICMARAGTGGTLDLPISNATLLYHEFSHARRIVTDTLLPLSWDCDPASPEENAAIVDENELRTQIAEVLQQEPQLRDPDIHCGKICEDGVGNGGTGGCCIIASLVSGSPTSSEVQLLRALRDRFVRKAEVGFAFFDQLFYDYYSFSPQVCTIVARRPELKDALREGYVGPLIDFWRLMVARPPDAPDDAELGALFERLHPDRERAARRLAALHRTRAYWQGELAAEDDAPRELLALLRERAWSSAHVRWALVEPIRIYRDLLEAYLGGASPEALGRAMRQAISGWAPELPLDHVWASLPSRLLAEELDLCESRLGLSADDRARFRRRLADRFGDITAIRAVVAEA